MFSINRSAVISRVLRIGLLLAPVVFALSACVTAPPLPPATRANAAPILPTSQENAPTSAPLQVPAATLTPPQPTVTFTALAQNAKVLAINIVEPPFKPVQSWAFDPVTVTVKVGTKINWTNTGAILHTATADDDTTFNSGDLQPKDTFSFTPAKTATIAYHCKYHPWMKGTIQVTP
ncbi:MAG: hypothetical protein HY741_01370 [Chloroflexi bacterium]|nr:hypothetical protein [Chloroflexota bacterium]